MFKFIHAADIHLDSPLRGLNAYAEAPKSQIRGAARQALQNLVRLAIDEKVQFVVIAGDVYDGDWQDFNTGLFFVAQMERLQREGIRVFLVSGNHDAASNMTRSLRLPGNVKVFSHEAPETVLLDEPRVALHGQSFGQRAVKDNLSDKYPSAIPGCLNIGILHTSATGREGHENYAPCTPEGLTLKGYDYWALGHIHMREELVPGSNIWFSGNLQGRHVRECGPKGVNVVTVSDGRIHQVEFVALDVLRWEVAMVSTEGIETLDEVVDRVADDIQELVDKCDGRLLAVRVELHGATPLHNELNAQRQQVTANIQACSLRFNDVWIEKVKLYTTPPAANQFQEQVSDDVISLLYRVFDSLPPNRELLEKELTDCLKKFPGDLADRLDIKSTEWITNVIEEARATLVQKLNA